jgi:hypothetical protein
VTVGRADVNGYVVLPAEGAGLLRRLEEGLTPGEAAIAAPPVRFERLARMVFSPAGDGCLAAALVACVVAMVRSPALVPGYHDLFFTRSMRSWNW